jgi:large conductance mechanosensitive channel
MLKGFRDFILRGNVIDLAVAVVIGAAFTALIGVFNTALITPIVNSFFDLLGLSKDGIGGTIGLPGDQVINIGLIVGGIITFLITAAVVYFVFVAPMNACEEPLRQGEGRGRHRRGPARRDPRPAQGPEAGLTPDLTRVLRVVGGRGSGASVTKQSGWGPSISRFRGTRGPGSAFS